MKVVIFAGGHGTRLWPLSRKNSPKQFEKFFDGKSTLQLTVERLLPAYGYEDIFVSTGEKYVPIIREQLPDLPANNVIGEPERRDLAAAVGLALMHVLKAAPDEPMAILWSDHLIEDEEQFRKMLGAAEKLEKEDSERIIFMAERLKFANENCGWITIGDKLGDVEGLPVHKFVGWKYAPPLEEAKRLFKSGKAIVNLGYFVVDPRFLEKQYKINVPEIHDGLQKIRKAIGTENYEKVLKDVYPTLEAMHFDHAIAEKIDKELAVVIETEMGWRDPGTLYALKEAMQKSKSDNVTSGKVFLEGSKDCLVLNDDKKKLVAGLGLESMIVVNTPDAMLVCHRDDIQGIRDLVKKLEESGLEGYV